MKDITLGQYVPGNSFVHRLDPRTKLLLMLLYIVMIFLVKEMWLFSVATVFVLTVTLLSKIPFSYVMRSLKPIRLIVIFMFILNVLTITSGDVIAEFWIIKLTWGGVEQGVFITIRLVLLIMGTSLLTLTTTPIALTDALEKLLSPLKKLKFPAHELAMMMTIALRFIPTLIEEADKIMKAQMARGADFESGNLIRRAKNMVPILIPLFIGAFRRADELAMAMESRCYHGGEGRTRMRVLKLGAMDAYAAAFTIILTAAIVVVQKLWY